MNESHENQPEHNDGNQSVERFERMLQNDEFYFFDVDEFEDLIDHYIEAGNPKNALKAVEMGCEQHPSSFSLLLYKAQILASTHKPRKALEILLKVESGEPNNIDVHLVKATVHSQLREYKKAIDAYRMALKLSTGPEKEDIYISMAFEFENMDEYRLATKYLKKTLALNPENETALYEIGFCFEIQEMCEQGIQYFEDFIDENPYSYAAWYNMGLLYGKIELFEKAINCYDFTIAIKDDFSSAWFNKANSYSRMEQYEDAIDSYKRTLDIDSSDGTTYFHIATCYEELENLEMALNYYHKSISSDPYFADAFLNLGFLYQELGRLNEGIHYVKKALELDPKQVDYLLAYGSLQIRMGFYTEAFQAFEEVIKIQDDQKEVWSLYAHGLYVSGERRSAKKLIQRAITMLPDNAMNYLCYAAILFKEGNINEGLEETENSIIIDQSIAKRLFNFYPDGVDNVDILELFEKYNIQ